MAVSSAAAQDAVNFFLSYGKNKKAAAVDATPTQQRIITQATPATVSTAVEHNVQTIVPVDKTKFTPSFRVQTLRTSPKNFSPYANMAPRQFLPSQTIGNSSRVTLVLDVDETLLHSSTEPVPGVVYDYEFDVEKDGMLYHVYVKLRPFVREFLDFISTRFEVVIFTASVSVYCNPVMDFLDPDGRLGNLRLFREHCSIVNKSHVKDLTFLNRDLNRVVIIDNSPVCYMYQQRNALPVLSWFDDPNDRELLKLLSVLAELCTCSSVYDVLDPFNAR